MVNNKSKSQMNTPEPDWGDADTNFDQICENDQEPEIGDISLRHDRNILYGILLRMLAGNGIGSLLPMWIFERRSLLEVYSQFFSQPFDLVTISDFPTTEERFLAAVKFYLKSLVGLRRQDSARKPYNPLLGEIFRCRWTLPNSKPSEVRTTSGPFPGSSINQLTYISEQVSHHPPISAFYAELPAQKVSYCGSIRTKVAVMSYLPPSIGAVNDGSGVLRLGKHGEEYYMNFPNAYGRDVMSRPWVEYGGTVKIKCPMTGYKATIDFKTNSSDGTRHKIEGSVSKDNEKYLKLHGVWNEIVYVERTNQKKSGQEVFCDGSSRTFIRKECEPISKQASNESRRIWRHVTAAMHRNDYQRAKEAKEWLSKRQHDEAACREKTKTKWTPKHFIRKDSNSAEWRYTLDKRLNI